MILTLSGLCFSAEIMGRVVEVDGRRAKIKYESEFAPGKGDKVRIGFNVDENFLPLEGEWKIVSVTRDFVWAEPKSADAGIPELDYLAIILSEDPVKRSEPASSEKIRAKANRTIKGTFAGVPQGSSGKIYLYSYYGSELTEIDSVPLNEKGGFEFKLTHPLQTGLYKLGFDLENASSIVISSSEKNIMVEAAFEDLKADNITVDNSRENDAYRLFFDEQTRFAGEMNALKTERDQISPVDPFFVRKTKEMDNKTGLLIEEYNRRLDKIKASYPDTFTAGVLVKLSMIPRLADHPEFKHDYDNEPAFLHDHYFDFIDFADDRVIHAPFLEEKYYAYLKEYTHHIPDGFRNSIDMIFERVTANNAVLEYTVQTLIDIFDQSGPEELVDYVVDKFDNYAEGCNLSPSESTAEKIQGLKRLRVGQLAPEIVSKDPDGNRVALSSLKGKKLVMLYFWAPWCDFCRIENPHFVKTYNQFKDKGFEVYAVALEKHRKEWLSAIKDDRLTWINVSDLKEWESESALAYNVRSTPTTYLLDKEGRIIAKKFSSDELEMKLDDILGGNE